MTLPDISVTSEMLWLSTLVTAMIDVALVIFLAHRIEVDYFRRLRWPIVVAAGVFWISYGLVLFGLTWESFYAKFLPDPANRSFARSMLELLPYPIIALLLWWGALRLPGDSAVNFCLLGGLQSLPEHLWGIYRLGMLESVPFLLEASPSSVLVFAVFEYILYWGSVLCIAMLMHNAWQRCRRFWMSEASEEAA